MTRARVEQPTTVAWRAVPRRVRAGLSLGVAGLWLLCTGPLWAQTWFPPSHEWVASQLRQLGFQTVRRDVRAVGGLWQAGEPDSGPIVVFSSDDPEAALKVLKLLGPPRRGGVLAVFGPDVTLKRGDFLLKVDFDRRLGADVVALPSAGPSIDTFELVLDDETPRPPLMVASDLVLTLQNRAATASELVIVQLEDYHAMEDGKLAVVLSLKVFDPSLRERAAAALERIVRQRLELGGTSLISLRREASPQSGTWPKLREALGAQVRIVQEDLPAQSELEAEDFGRPQMPSVTLRAGSADPVTLQALARVLDGALNLDPAKR